MRPYLPFMLLFAVLLGCGKQKNADDQAGSATQSAFSEVIDGKQGYIIEQAAFTTGTDNATYNIGDRFKLSPGQSSVMIIRINETEKQAGCLLAVQFPSFAAGTTQDYNGDTTNARFWIMGKSGGQDVMVSTGLISGSVQCMKKSKSALNLGLNREILDGIGDVEIVVSNIKANGLTFPTEKKFAARFQLPIITLVEMSRVTQPT